MGKQGNIFDISRFCLSDGPGIRTTVFLKGCPLRCLWCHNPESQKTHPEIMYSPVQCVNCGVCAGVCDKTCHIMGDSHEFSRSLCQACGKCAQACPSGALRVAGKTCGAEEIMKETTRDREYYEESGGGLTISGGEPMLQIDFLEELLLLAKQERINTYIETCGYAKKEDFERILPLADGFLFDWKETNPDLHKKFTGVYNEIILENLEFLDKAKAEIILRIPLIPGYNDRKDHAEGIARLANKYKSIKKVEIMPYHPLGTGKAEELGKEEIFSTAVPDSRMINDFLEEIKKISDITVDVSL